VRRRGRMRVVGQPRLGRLSLFLREEVVVRAWQLGSEVLGHTRGVRREQAMLQHFESRALHVLLI